MKQNNWDIVGSCETNFNAVWKPGYKPILGEVINNKIKIIIDKSEIPTKGNFLVNVIYGEENSVDKNMVEILIEAFNKGFIVNGVLTKGDNNYFHLVRL